MITHIRLKLIATLSILILSAPASLADDYDDLARLIVEYDNSADKVVVANDFMSKMRSEGFFDHKVVFSGSTPLDSINKWMWYWAGEYYLDCQEYDKALAYSKKALPLCSKAATDKSDCLGLMSIIYFRLSDYASAINASEESLAIDRQLGDHSRISSSLNTIAGIYLASKEPQKGERYILEAIEHSTMARDSSRMAIQYGMASEIYHLMNKNQEALSHAEHAFYLDSVTGKKSKLGIRLSQIASAQMALGMSDKALASLNRALPILQSNGQQTSYGICNNQLGELLLSKNQPGKAIQAYRKALDVFIAKRDLYNEGNSRLGLYKALKATAPAEALIHLERYAAIKDTLYNKDMQQALQEYDAKFRNEELLLENSKAKLKNTLTLTIAIAVVLTMAIIVVLLSYRYKTRRRRQMLQKELLDSKERFFTQITHEFRTPLTVIHSAAQNILNHSAVGSDAYQDAGHILHHENSLLELINQILETGRLSAGSSMPLPQCVHANVVGLLSMLCESYSAFAADKGIRIIYAPQNDEVEMDFYPDYVKRIMQNLIANAIKYSPRDSDVLISSRVEDNLLAIYVSDSGKGISADKINDIFRPYYRDSECSISESTGIGLSIVKLCVEAMHGTVDVYSVVDHGSTFVVKLPIVQGDAALQYGGGQQIVDDADFKSFRTENVDDDIAAGDSRLRILIVEDTADVAHYIKLQLNQDYSYFFAKDGEEALEKAGEIVPDLIITDIMMPGIDGFELCQRIRASELLCHIPVVMVTAKVKHDDRVRGLEVGADAYLEKPFHADELNVRVEKLLEQRQLLREKFTRMMTAKIVETSHGEDADSSDKELEQVNEPERAFIKKFIEVVHGYMLQGKIDYDSLAYAMSLSRIQLNRKIKAITGYTTTEYILHIRISLAKQLFDTTDMLVYEVALKCGIDNATYFSVLFKKYTGLTPQQYKARPRD